jgi:hypothetical protein
MKYLLKIKQYCVKQLLQSIIAVLVISILPNIVFGQVPTPPGGNGSLPDNPLSVPFDDHLSIFLLIAGIILSIVVIMRFKKNYVAKAIQ